MRKISSVACAVLCVLLGCNEADEEFQPGDGPVANQDGKNNALKAVGAYNGKSRCTAVFVRLSENLSAPAYVLTNGHCVQEWDAQRVFRDVPADDQSVTFNVFSGVPEAEQVNVPARRIAYSTMKATDLGIVELQATVKELADRGIHPLSLANAVPAAGVSIEVYGVPVDDLPQNEWWLRRSSGIQGRRTNLLEFSWTWWDMTANNAGGIRGGSSGSPAMLSVQEGVFGLINTTTAGGKSPCYLGAPCEVASQGTQMQPNTNYTLSVVQVKSCFNASGQFDAGQPGCPLDKGDGVILSGYPLGPYNPTVPESAGRPKQLTWNTTVSGYPYYRYKTGPVATTDPRNLNGYGPVVSAATAIRDSIPKKEGQYFLSVIGGNTLAFDARWQAAANATVVRAEVDLRQPAVAPGIVVQDMEDSYRVTLAFDPPELSDYRYKIGPPASTDARDPKGYQTYRRIPLTILKKELPLKLCVIGYDAAGNATEPVEQIFK